ncbi:MAG: nucleoside 2-deoxyribosyltransferase [Thermomicrobiales bacterium]
MKIYLASPLGFAESTRAFMDRLIGALSAHVEVVNPWDDHRFDDDFARVPAIRDVEVRRELLVRINYEIGRANEERIRSCDTVVAILDGVDVDSGTAAEVGFAYGLGKLAHGLRTDFRMTGDNEAAGVNLQVRYFIEASGGQYFTSVDELITALAG